MLGKRVDKPCRHDPNLVCSLFQKEVASNAAIALAQRTLECHHKETQLKAAVLCEATGAQPYGLL